MHAVAHHNEYEKQGPFIHHHKDQTKHRHDHHSEYAMVYSDEIEDKIDLIIAQFKEKYPDMDNMRWHAVKMLEQDETVMKQYPVDLNGIADRSYEKDIINEKYDFIEEVIDETLVNKSAKEERTDRIDRFMTGKWTGLPIFLVIMALVFFLTFTVGDWLKGYFETGLDLLTGAASGAFEATGVSPVIESLIVDGIISGVGGILTFLPNIFILFLALAFLEDSGYMARVAFVMDDIMGHLGLSGRAFLPMLLGFGCSVPAVMASRALEHKKDRLKTILVTPFMSCSARLPIYVLFSSMFFGDHAMLACYSMYLLCSLCVGEGEGLSHESRNSHLPGVYHYVDPVELRNDRICDRYLRQLRLFDRKSNRTRIRSAGAGLLADRGSADLGDRGKRSGCVQLQCAVRDPEYYHISRDGKLRGAAGRHGIRRGKRIFSYGVLSAVCALYGYHRYDQPRGRQQEDDDCHHRISAGDSMGCKFYCISYRRTVPVMGETADSQYSKRSCH